MKRPKTFEQVGIYSAACLYVIVSACPYMRSCASCLQLCKECFYAALEDEVHQTVVSNALFSPGEVVALGASGGKDSTVLAHIISLLNKRHKYVHF